MTDRGAIRVGVVGLGYFGAHHVRHYAANPRASLVAVADIDTRRAAEVAAAHGAVALADHRAMIGRVDAVSVTAPTSLHHAIAGELVDAGIHVFVEKPITADAASAADLVMRAERQDARLQVGHIERFAPAFRALMERVEAPRLIEAVRRTPWSGRALDVDVVLDLMIHDIDLVLTLAASPVVSVSASGLSVATGRNDAVAARVTFANGIVATLATSRVAATPERTIAVTEPGRRLMADLARPELVIVSAAEGGGIAEERITLDKVDNLAAEVDAFLASVASGARPPVDGRAGLDALKLAEAILEAAGNPSASPVFSGVHA